MVKRAICTLVLCVVLCLPASIAPTLSATSTSPGEPYVFLRSWGSEIGAFDSPTGIAVSGDRVYIADSGNHRIKVFDVHGTPLFAFGRPGTGEGQFDHPAGIAMDRSRTNPSTSTKDVRRMVTKL